MISAATSSSLPSPPKAGNYFYILIDRANEDKETAVHFLNQVDDADLAALTEEGQTQEETPAVCTCTEKCEAGAVDTNCPVCSVNMTECAGKEPNPPEETPRTGGTRKAEGLNPAVLLLVLALMGGIGAVIYLKFIRKKPQTTATHDPDDYEYDDGEEIPDEEEIEIEDEESEEPDTGRGRHRGKRGQAGMIRFTDSPYERMMTRRRRAGRTLPVLLLYLPATPVMAAGITVPASLVWDSASGKCHAGSRKGGIRNEYPDFFYQSHCGF